MDIRDFIVEGSIIGENAVVAERAVRKAHGYIYQSISSLQNMDETDQQVLSTLYMALAALNNSLTTLKNIQDRVKRFKNIS